VGSHIFVNNPRNHLELPKLSAILTIKNIRLCKKAMLHTGDVQKTNHDYRDCYILNQALEGFHNNLSAKQKAEFELISGGTPKPEDVSALVAKINLKDSKRKSRICADKLRTILDPTQQYCAVVDTFIQSNPTLAASVWRAAKIFILVFKPGGHSGGRWVT
jgi:hypothetical protein